jgi:hypothetical protein
MTDLTSCAAAFAGAWRYCIEPGEGPVLARVVGHACTVVFEEAREHGLADLALARDSGPLLAQPSLQCDHQVAALIARAAAPAASGPFDRALDREQGTDALDRLDCDRRLSRQARSTKLRRAMSSMSPR